MDIFNNTFEANHWYDRIATAKMISHRFLTDDSQVEETVFAPGVRIVVNYNKEIRNVNNLIIRPHSYIIE